jgi:hypothetical protein
MSDTTTNTTVPQPRNTNLRRRMIAAGLVGLVAVGVGAYAATAGGSDSDTTRTAATPTTTVVEPGTELVLVDTASPAPAPKTPPAPQPQPQPEAPAEPEAPADPGVLDVNKSMIDMPANTWVGSFQVRNDGGSALDWQWVAGDTGVSVSQSGGTLQPGEFVDVSFSIDHTVLPAGDYLFANCVISGDQAKDVYITGTKTIVVNPGIELPDPVLTFE